MKKFSLVITLLVFVILFSACKVSTPTEEVPEINFSTMASTLETNDGWVYYCYAEFDKDSNIQDARSVNFSYDAYNIKYNYLEDCRIPVIDSNTGEIMDYQYSSIPYISLIPEFNRDFAKVENWLEENKPISPISKTDIEDLDLKIMDVDLFIKLFNEMITSQKLETGAFYNYFEGDMKREEIYLDGYKWQIGYVVMHGVMKNINIELLYYDDTQNENDKKNKDDEYFRDGIHLSDIVNTGKATPEQIQIQKTVDELEKKIIESQNLFPENLDYSIGDIDFNRLEHLLKSLGE